MKAGIISKYTRIAGIAATLPDKLRHMVTLLKGLRNLHVTQEAINKEPWKVFHVESDVIKLCIVEGKREDRETQ